MENKKYNHLIIVLENDELKCFYSVSEDFPTKVNYNDYKLDKSISLGFFDFYVGIDNNFYCLTLDEYYKFPEFVLRNKNINIVDSNFLRIKFYDNIFFEEEIDYDKSFLQSFASAYLFHNKKDAVFVFIINGKSLVELIEYFSEYNFSEYPKDQLFYE